MLGWTGRAVLYRCDPPLNGHEYIIVSTITSPHVASAIFPAHIKPVTTETTAMDVQWGAIQQSDAPDHAAALDAHGYTIKAA